MLGKQGIQKKIFFSKRKQSWCSSLMLGMLGKKFNRWYFEIFILFILENRIWHFMQIVS